MPRFLVFLILALPLVGAYAMYSMGIVVIHQASRVLNLAHGAMAAIPAYVVYTMAVRWGVPLVVAVPVGIASGAALGVMVERVFVRRLRPAGSTAQTVGTIAAFGLLIALAAKVWGTTGLSAPGIFPEGHINVGSSILRWGQIGLLGAALATTAALAALFRFTWLGLAMRGAAVNRRAASLMGVDPNMTSTVAWALGGALAAGAGILLAAVTVLHPVSLSASVLPAFVAALIGGLESVSGALLGSAIVGLLIGSVPAIADLPGLRLVLGQVGGPELALAVTAMVVMALRGKRLVASDVREAAVSIAARAEAVKLPRISPRLGLLLLVGWIWIPGMPFTVLGDANQAILYLIAAASVVLLTGWIGQISLAQASFVGVGAFVSAQVSQRLGIPFPLTLPIALLVSGGAAAALGMVALRVRGLYLAVATLIFGWMADQYLFSAPWLVGAGGSATARNDPIGYEGGFPYFNFTDRRIFYTVALAACAIVMLGLANLRGSKTGRAFLAIRGSEMAAASVGVDVTRYKLLAFALSGCIAGVAGSLIALGQGTIVPAQFNLSVSLFYLSVAVVGGLQSLGGAVASSIVFALLAELFFRVDALRGWLDVVSAGLLVAVLVFYPGGLARLRTRLAPMVVTLHAHTVRFLALLMPAERGTTGTLLAKASALIATGARRLLGEVRGLGREVAEAGDGVLRAAEGRGPDGWRGRVRALRAQLRGVGAEASAVGAAARSVKARIDRIGTTHGTVPGGPPDALGAVVRGEKPIAVPADARARGRPERELVRAESLTVVFGGVTAVDDASLSVREGEIVGLIGPNGAGKTTMFNAIAGFVTPTEGSVHLFGEDVTELSVHERALRGMGRTFQMIQLSGELTVRENLLVATHGRNPSGFGSHLVAGAHTIVAEHDATRRVAAAAEIVGVTDVLDRPAGDLPFGVLRMVEVARAIVTGAPLVMLDEPASGLDETETLAFRELLIRLREQLGISMLLIEHDVNLVMSLCDYVSVLDGGQIIAEGTPEAVKADPAVIGAYLGEPTADGERSVATA